MMDKTLTCKVLICIFGGIQGFYLPTREMDVKRDSKSEFCPLNVNCLPFVSYRCIDPSDCMPWLCCYDHINRKSCCAEKIDLSPVSVLSIMNATLVDATTTASVEQQSTETTSSSQSKDPPEVPTLGTTSVNESSSQELGTKNGTMASLGATISSGETGATDGRTEPTTTSAAVQDVTKAVAKPKVESGPVTTLQNLSTENISSIQAGPTVLNLDPVTTSATTQDVTKMALGMETGPASIPDSETSANVGHSDLKTTPVTIKNETEAAKEPETENGPMTTLMTISETSISSDEASPTAGNLDQMTTSSTVQDVTKVTPEPKVESGSVTTLQNLLAASISNNETSSTVENLDPVTTSAMEQDVTPVMENGLASILDVETSANVGHSDLKTTPATGQNKTKAATEPEVEHGAVTTIQNLLDASTSDHGTGNLDLVSTSPIVQDVKNTVAEKKVESGPGISSQNLLLTEPETNNGPGTTLSELDASITHGKTRETARNSDPMSTSANVKDVTEAAVKPELENRLKTEPEVQSVTNETIQPELEVESFSNETVQKDIESATNETAQPEVGSTTNETVQAKVESATNETAQPEPHFQCIEDGGANAIGSIPELLRPAFPDDVTIPPIPANAPSNPTSATELTSTSKPLVELTTEPETSSHGDPKGVPADASESTLTERTNGSNASSVRITETTGSGETNASVAELMITESAPAVNESTVRESTSISNNSSQKISGAGNPEAGTSTLKAVIPVTTAASTENSGSNYTSTPGPETPLLFSVQGETNSPTLDQPKVEPATERDMVEVTSSTTKREMQVTTLESRGTNTSNDTSVPRTEVPVSFSLNGEISSPKADLLNLGFATEPETVSHSELTPNTPAASNNNSNKNQPQDECLKTT